jgi:hypothetical protein
LVSSRDESDANCSDASCSRSFAVASAMSSPFDTSGATAAFAVQAYRANRLFRLWSSAWCHLAPLSVHFGRSRAPTTTNALPGFPTSLNRGFFDNFFIACSRAVPLLAIGAVCDADELGSSEPYPDLCVITTRSFFDRIGHGTIPRARIRACHSLGDWSRLAAAAIPPRVLLIMTQPRQTNDTIIDLAVRGHTRLEIAGMIGVSPATVNGILRRAGVKPRLDSTLPRRWTRNLPAPRSSSTSHVHQARRE